MVGVQKQKDMYISKYKNTKMCQKGTVQDTKECHMVTYTYIYYINRNNTGCKWIEITIERKNNNMIS